MADRIQIVAALADVETTFAAMATTVDAADMDQRRQLIAHRRSLAEGFAELNRAIDAAIAAGKIAPELASDYHSKSAVFRRSVSLHQAEWPTILISDDVTGYLAASRILRAKREEFIGFMRERFLPRVGA